MFAVGSAAPRPRRRRRTFGTGRTTSSLSSSTTTSPQENVPGRLRRTVGHQLDPSGLYEGLDQRLLPSGRRPRRRRRRRLRVALAGRVAGRALPRDPRIAHDDPLFALGHAAQFPQGVFHRGASWSTTACESASGRGVVEIVVCSVVPVAPVDAVMVLAAAETSSSSPPMEQELAIVMSSPSPPPLLRANDIRGWWVAAVSWRGA